MPVTTRRTANASQGDEIVALDTVNLPLVDLPEWAENTLQVVSFGAYTPRSAERRASDNAARLSRESSVGVAVALDYEEYKEDSAVMPSPPQTRKSPRLLSSETTLRALDAKEGRAADARLKAKALAESAKAGAAGAAAAIPATAADDSDEVDDIIKSRAAKLKRARKKDSKAMRAREAQEEAERIAAEAAAAEAAIWQEAEASAETESDVESDDEKHVVEAAFGSVALPLNAHHTS